MKLTPRKGVAETVTANTFWYGLELLTGVVGAVFVSVPMARIMGPEKLGYFTYLQWLTNVGTLVAMAGVPGATRKFIADAVGAGNDSAVWHVYSYSLRLQSYLLAVTLVLGGILMVRLTDPSYTVIGLVLLLGAAPKMLGSVFSAANLAAAQLKSNTVGAVAGNLLTVVLVCGSLFGGLGLLGVAVGMLIGSSVEVIVKALAMRHWLKRPKNPGVMPPAARKSMLRFSRQGLVLLLLNLVVWDRSDFVFLKWLGNDIRQVTFFGLAFNLVDKILMLPRSFSTALGVSVMAEYSRNRERFYQLAALAAKYALLTSVPVMFGLAAVSGPLIRLMYGEKYHPVIPVLVIAALFGAVKPLLAPVQTLLQAEDRQHILIRSGILAGAINITLDILLIPVAAARGAMVANGLAQAMAVLGFWVLAARKSPLRIPVRDAAKIQAAGLVMMAAVFAAGSIPMHDVFRLTLEVPLGAAVYMSMLRFLSVLNQEDEMRLARLACKLPGPVRRWADRCLMFVAPSARMAASC